jgi:L,D-transpeptidase YcbB
VCFADSQTRCLREKCGLEVKRNGSSAAPIVTMDPLQSNGLTRSALAKILAALSLGLALSMAATAAHAQGSLDSWWQSLPWFVNGGNSPNDKRHLNELQDLRSGSTPLRSEIMIEALEDAIERYQRIVSNGGWQTIPGASVQPGDDAVRVPRLRQRLTITGELPRGQSDSVAFFDDLADVRAALRRFQSKNGLGVTGYVDIPTLQALNVPAEVRLLQLRTSLQRLRELTAQNMEHRYILVNVPAFQLEAVESNQVEQRHRIIAGKPERPTPTVRANIKAINFFPYWRVPESVVTLDVIPRLMQEPDFLRKQQIRVLSGSYNGPEINSDTIDWRQVDATKLRLRQDQGPLNALGLVRLDMPNDYGVYMHDTPTKEYFDRPVRAISAGCVRVQDVFSLVEWVTRYEPGWEQPGRVRDVLNSGNALDLNLTRPVPVYFAYITAWAEPNGTIQFRPDIYARDATGERYELGPAQPVALAP